MARTSSAPFPRLLQQSRVSCDDTAPALTVFALQSETARDLILDVSANRNLPVNMRSS
jgi:hypothetical protein